MALASMNGSISCSCKEGSFAHPLPHFTRHRVGGGLCNQPGYLLEGLLCFQGCPASSPPGWGSGLAFPLGQRGTQTAAPRTWL